MTDKAKTTSWNKEYTAAVLLHIHSYQTEEEQIDQYIQEKNDMGFNGIDAEICCSMAEYFIRNQFLTPKQLQFLQKALPKYHRQIPEGLEEQKFRNGTPQKKHTKSPEKGLTGKQARLEKDLVIIKFPYDTSTISKIKTLSGRKWNAREKHWTCPPGVFNLESLQKWGFCIDDNLVDIINANTAPPVDIKDIKGLPKNLYNYQKEGVGFLESRNGRAIIADSMGLGKTAQALAWLKIHSEARPAIIICPNSLKLNWEKEAKRWIGKNTWCQIAYGKIPQDLEEDILIINYDILKAWLPLLLKQNIQAVILDENQYIKNPKSQRSRAVTGYTDTKKIFHPGLCTGVKHVMALSGTPITSRPIEFWPTIHLIAPQVFPSFWNFVQTYCGAKNDGYGWDFTGHSNTKELHDKLIRTCMIRRKKSEVLKDLPPKTRAIVPIEKNEKNYKKAKQEWDKWLKGTWTDKEGTIRSNKDNPAAAMVELGKLKKATVLSKLDSCVEWVADYLESGNKLVVFAHHKEIINHIMSKFPDIAVKVDGSVTGIKRQQAVDTFQENPECRLFVGNLKAAGIGLTLVAAQDTCTIEFLWNPGDHQQAEDRTHRIGQEDPVTAYYLVAENSIELDIMKLVEAKAKILDQILDGVNAGDESIFSALIDKLTGGK